MLVARDEFQGLNLNERIDIWGCKKSLKLVLPCEDHQGEI
jgi:hypothetical protein